MALTIVTGVNPFREIVVKLKIKTTTTQFSKLPCDNQMTQSEIVIVLSFG